MGGVHSKISPLDGASLDTCRQILPTLPGLIGPQPPHRHIYLEARVSKPRRQRAPCRGFRNRLVRAIHTLVGGHATHLILHPTLFTDLDCLHAT